MKKRGDSVELVKFPPSQHSARDDAANRVHPGYCRKCFIIIHTLFLSIALNDEASFADSISLSLEYLLIADYPISSRNFFTADLLLCSILKERRIFFVNGYLLL